MGVSLDLLLFAQMHGREMRFVEAYQMFDEIKEEEERPSYKRVFGHFCRAMI